MPDRLRDKGRLEGLAMKVFRIALAALAAIILLGPARAEVRTIWPAQELVPPNQTFTQFGLAVAIDGGAIIVLAEYEGGQAALLYRRTTTNGPWTYRRTLLSVGGPHDRASVRMKNGLAAVQFGDLVTIFEYSGGDYVRGRGATSFRRPGGIAISGNSILVGGNDCDYDAVIYQKGADGNWGLTGRMDDHQGECRPDGLNVELNYDYALLSVPMTNQVTAWRRGSGTGLNWVRAGNLEKPPGSAVSAGQVALQNATAVAPGSFVFRRSGTTWTPQPMLAPVDYANGTGSASDVRYRDGVLLTTEAWTNRDARLHAYLERSPGRFEHVAIVYTHSTPADHDVSGRTVVATSLPMPNNWFRVVQVFNLPTPLEGPSTIVNDFEQRDLSGFTFEGGQFALATRGTNDVLERTNVTGVGVALVNGSDSGGFQRIEAALTPNYSGAGWVGVVVRYVDADNYYYVAFRNDNTFGIYRRLNGVNTLLSDWQLYEPLSRVSVTSDGESLWVENGRHDRGSARDTSLRHGRAGLATFQTRADFDDVLVDATEPIFFQQKAYVPGYSDYSRPFTELGGRWELVSDGFGGFAGLAQVDVNASALAFGGTPVENQEVIGVVRFDAFGSSQQAWFGLLARYVDARNHYSLTVGRTNLLQIRKQVNGVSTVLASVAFTAVPRQFHEYRLRVVGDQLHAYVDGELVAWARDGDIARGKFGIGTYRARAMWQAANAIQP